MGTRIWHDTENERAGYYCSTRGESFGPTFIGELAREQAEAFLSWLGADPRLKGSIALNQFQRDFLAEFRAQADGAKWLDNLCKEAA